MKNRFGFLIIISIVIGTLAQFFPQFESDIVVVKQIQNILLLMKPVVWAMAAGALVSLLFLLTSFGSRRLFVWAAVCIGTIAGGFYVQFQNPVAGVLGLVFAALAVLLVVYRGGLRRKNGTPKPAADPMPESDTTGANAGEVKATGQEVLAMLAGHPSFANVGKVVEHQAETEKARALAQLIQERRVTLDYLSQHAKELGLSNSELQEIGRAVAELVGVTLKTSRPEPIVNPTRRFRTSGGRHAPQR